METKDIFGNEAKTEVKLTCAEDSQLETACENRQSPTFIWPVGQAVKTEASHAFNIGSIPVRVTICTSSSVGRATDS